MDYFWGTKFSKIQRTIFIVNVGTIAEVVNVIMKHDILVLNIKGLQKDYKIQRFKKIHVIMVNQDKMIMETKLS